MVSIREVRTARDRREFVMFPLRLYRGCRYFVPPLLGDEKKLLRTARAKQEAESVFFLALREGKTVGRIQGIIQKQYNRIHGTRKARFTRFDSIDDEEVARALFLAVEQWGAARGMDELCGPLGYNDLEREGLLIEGFEEESTFEEQYNYPYYPRLLESAGFRKDVDWLEYELKMPAQRNEMLSRVAARTLEMNKLHMASTDLSKRAYIKRYRDGFFECLDECYSKLYGTVPIEKKVQNELVSQFMLIVNKRHLLFICDENDRVVAFGLCLPGIGEALAGGSGRLTPRTLFRLLRVARRPRVADLALVAVRPEYQNSGINAVLLEEMLRILAEGGIEKYETNLNLETNTAVQAQWKYFAARQHKRRRAYIKTIGE